MEQIDIEAMSYRMKLLHVALKIGMEVTDEDNDTVISLNFDNDSQNRLFYTFKRCINDEIDMGILTMASFITNSTSSRYLKINGKKIKRLFNTRNYFIIKRFRS